MTIKMSEDVVLHPQYDFVTQSDFEVEYFRNSDESEQDLEY